MDRRIATLAGVLFLATFVGMQSSSSAPNTLEEVSRKNATPSSEKDSIVVPLSELGPWEASCDYFQPTNNGTGEGPNNNPGLELRFTDKVQGQLEALDHKDGKLAAAKADPRARWCVPAGPPPEFLIVTVPDPVNSHLALEFDRRMESIAWAATDAHYVNDQFWLPWEPNAGMNKKSDDPAKVRAETMLTEIRQTQPGLLIFRPAQEKTKPAEPPKPPLFVFLAGETPTNGVNKEQLWNALKYIRIMNNLAVEGQNKFANQPKTRILGPSYSGSVPSMMRVLRSYECKECFHIIPSSATSRAALDDLSGDNIRREEVLHDDSVANVSFLCYVQAKLRIDAKDVAVLSESDTTFGNIGPKNYEVLEDVKEEEKKKEKEKEEKEKEKKEKEKKRKWGESMGRSCDLDKITGLRFPREISSLRNAYPDRPVSFSAQPANGKSQDAPFLGLPLHLRDQELQVTPDAVPEFSRDQIPLSQEAMLYQIAATIRRKKIKLIEIRATNIFDTLFLASFLREFCPDTRLAVLDADLLLVRSNASIPLEGTLSVSTYPQISLNQGWTGTSKEGNSLLLNFPSQATEATYNGFLALMSESDPDVGLRLRDFRSPEKSDLRLHPPLWLTAVGRNGFVPIGLIPEIVSDAQTSKKIWWKCQPLALCANAPDKISPLGYSLPTPSGGYLFMAGTILVFAAFWHLFGVYQRTKPMGPFPQWWLSYFNVEGKDERGQKLYFLLAGTLTLIVACVLVFLPIWAYTAWDRDSIENWPIFFFDYLLFVATPWFFRGTDLSDPRRWYQLVPWIAAVLALWIRANTVTLWFCLFSLLALTICSWLLIQAYQLHRDARAAQPPAPRWLLGSAWATGALALSPWVWLGFVTRSGMRSAFFLYRTAEVASGVSPLVPVLFLLAAFYCWTWAHLRRIRYWEMRRIAVPTKKLDEAFEFGLTDKAEELDSDFRSVRIRDTLLLVVIGITLAFLLLARVRNHVAGVEPFTVFHGSVNHFDWMVFFLLFWLWSFVFACWVRFAHCWYLLQIILSGLERTMLRRAFDKLPRRIYSWTPVWQAFGGQSSYVLLTRSRECLERLLRKRKDDVLDLSDLRARESSDSRFRKSEKDTLSEKLTKFFEDEANGNLNLSGRLNEINIRLCSIAEYLVTELLPYWRKSGASDTLEEIESKSKNPDDHQLPEQILLAEEFIVLRFMTLLRYVSLQLRNLLSFVAAGFVLGVFALRSYPFLASRAIGWTLTLIFVTLGIGVVVVFAQMSKDAILSRIADTDPGKLSGDFYFRIVSFGALPLLTLLASQFPSVGRFLFSWIQPGIEALH